MEDCPTQEGVFQQKLAGVGRALSAHTLGSSRGPWVFPDLMGLRLQQTSAHLSKYWSDGGSSLPEVVKWHACLWEGRQKGGRGELLATALRQVSSHRGSPPPTQAPQAKGRGT